jgi:hypothetical protein
VTRAEILLLVLIGLLSSVAYGADEDRARKCRAAADWVVEMFNDHKAGIIVNVMPRDEVFLNRAKEYKGTAEELRKEIFSECTGVKV